ncbi:MAG: winged helix-turn-helix transcriptional regulator [Bacteroidales bacterium]|nr:winged helix-turn-helix transcriptional regulator [Bacteroidales bacterium]
MIDNEFQLDYSEHEKEMARFAKALAHPARIAILKLLAARNTCICNDMVKELPLAQATVSQHLKELKDAGLVQGNITPPSVKYCINRQNWELARKMFEEFFK